MLSKILLAISIDCSDVNWILKFKHLDFNVGNILLLLLIKIKFILSFGSSRIFNKALTAFILSNSILSINTNLGLVLKEDLFNVRIKFLIWLISIFFFSSWISTNIKLGLDLFWTNLNDLLSGIIFKLSKSYEKSSFEDKI